MKNDVLISIPLFLFMGYIIERAGTLDELFPAASSWRWTDSGLARCRDAATCTIFATATGIVGASVTLIGLLAFPAMMRRLRHPVRGGHGYRGGTLGILIPPSVLLILYGSVASVSVPRLYAGAFLPGLMLVLAVLLLHPVRGSTRIRRPRRRCRGSSASVLTAGADGAADPADGRSCR